MTRIAIPTGQFSCSFCGKPAIAATADGRVAVCDNEDCHGNLTLLTFQVLVTLTEQKYHDEPRENKKDIVQRSVRVLGEGLLDKLFDAAESRALIDPEEMPEA